MTAGGVLALYRFVANAAAGAHSSSAVSSVTSPPGALPAFKPARPPVQAGRPEPPSGVVGKDFPTAGHLASYAGLAPVTRRSGISSRGNTHHPATVTRSSNAPLFLSAFAALSDPVSRAYYDRKRAQQKKHNEASSSSPGAAWTSSTPCSETTGPTPTRHLLLLDKGHRGTPPQALR